MLVQPGVHALLENVERQGAGAEQFVVECAHVEFIAQRQFSALANLQDLELAIAKGEQDQALREEIDTATQEAKGGLIGSTMVSDAFFPFRDGVDVGLKEGVTAVVQPGGSMRDFEVIEACNEKGATMIFTGQRAFKH